MPVLSSTFEKKIGTAESIDRRGYKTLLCAVEGAGSPIGSVTPEFTGQAYYDTTNKDWYIATDASANTDWAGFAFPDISPAELAILDGLGVPQAEIQALDPSQKFTLFDDFFGTWAIGDAGPADRWSSTAGSGTGNEVATTVANSVNGEITLKSASDDGTHAANCSSLTAINASFKANQGGLVLEAKVKLDDVSEGVLFVGFTDTISTTVELPIFMNAGVLDSDAANACGVIYDVDATTDQFYVGGVKADTDTDPTADNAVAPEDDTYVTIRVEVSAAGAVTGYIDGVSLGTVADAVTITTALTPCIVVGNRSANQVVGTIDYIWAQQNR